MRPLVALGLSLACMAIGSTVAGAQTPPAALNWAAEDADRIRWLEQHGRRAAGKQVVIYAPADSMSASWQHALVDTLDNALARLRRTMRGPYPWQRIGDGPVTFYLSPGRFVAHASGYGAVFIPISRVHERLAPFLHEASHELLAPEPPFYPREFSDTVGLAQARRHPLWLFEGVPDYLAQSVSAQTGFHEGDVFEIGGLGKVDSVCAARVASSPRRQEILGVIGSAGRLEALFTTERATIAPAFYACSQSLTKHLIDLIGVREVVGLFPAMKNGTWRDAIARAAAVSMDTITHRWKVRLGLAVADSSADLRAFRGIIDDFNRSWAERDARIFVKHFAPEGDFMQAFGRYRGTRAGTEDFMDWFLSGQSATFQSREVGTRVKMVTPDVAFLEAEFTGEGIRNADGTFQPDRRGQMMLVLARREGRWQVISYRYLDIHAGAIRR